MRESGVYDGMLHACSSCCCGGVYDRWSLPTEPDPKVMFVKKKCLPGCHSALHISLRLRLPRFGYSPSTHWLVEARYPLSWVTSHMSGYKSSGLFGWRQLH